jgi:hypothetical protein
MSGLQHPMSRHQPAPRKRFIVSFNVTRKRWRRKMQRCANDCVLVLQSRCPIGVSRLTRHNWETWLSWCTSFCLCLLFTAVWWLVTLCNLVGGYKHFIRICCLDLQVRFLYLEDRGNMFRNYTVKMDLLYEYSSKTCPRTTLRHGTTVNIFSWVEASNQKHIPRPDT